MTYQIEVIRTAVKQLAKLPRRDQRRIRDAIDELAEAPRPTGAKKLVGSDFTWRLRVGDYRVIYEIRDERLLVLVICIGHRRDIYRSRT
jgi:mRNA interferase RelE/StbE